jgi:2-polyprenyl-3-methyl-5-hydroxy-6-metoxy-1,4-benzoquinol methylase
MDSTTAFKTVSELYRSAPPQHRYYVSTKLRTDPLAEELYHLAEHDLGRVVDAGAGRGQFGLLLLVLGAARSVRGFDLDQRKVQAAMCAAEEWQERDKRTFEHCRADLMEADYSGADTILLLDVLHYLPRPEQKFVIERAAAALPSCGRLVVRETGRGTGIGAHAAQWLERVGRFLGANGGRAMEFLAPEEIKAQMTASGFLVQQKAPRGALKNVLLIGTKPS